MLIEDGTGSGSKAHVTHDNRIDVSARSNPRIAYVSRDHGHSFTWSHFYDYAAADTILLVSNSSPDEKLHIDSILIGSDTATMFTVHCPAYPTLAGTAITGVNMNRLSGVAAEAEAYGAETGNTQGDVIYNGMLAASRPLELLPEGCIILGYHDCIAVDLVTAGTLGTVTISGYFE